jgi:hypothetical protein
MNKLKTFFRTVLKSSTQPSYGNDILTARPSFSWKYLFFFHFLIALALTLLVSIPLAVFNPKSLVDEGVKQFPSDLEIRLDQDGLSINQELPYSITIPGSEDAEYQAQGANLPDNFVTFASDEMIDGIRDVPAYDSFLVVTESTVYALTDVNTGKIEVQPIPPMEKPLVINQAQVSNFITTLMDHPFFKYRLYIPLLTVLILVVLFPLMVLWRVIGLFVFAIVTFMITSIFFKAKGLSFGNVYRLSFHTITPVIILSNVLAWVNLNYLTGWWYFLAYLGWTLVMVSNLTFNAGEAEIAAARARVSTPAKVKADAPMISLTKVKTKKAVAKNKKK